MSRVRRSTVRRALLSATVLGLVAAVSPPAHPAPPPLFPRQAVSTTNTPTEAVLADVDDDGIDDLIAVVGRDDSANLAWTLGVAVLRGSPDVGFNPGVLYASAQRGLANLDVADLDGDGHLDVVARERGLGTTDVLAMRGDGNGGFLDPIELGLRARAVTTAQRGGATVLVISTGTEVRTLAIADDFTTTVLGSVPLAGIERLVSGDLHGNGEDAVAAYGLGEVVLMDGGSVTTLENGSVRDLDIANGELLVTWASGEVHTIRHGEATLLAPSGSGATQSVRGDLDGDGELDLITGANNSVLTVRPASGGEVTTFLSGRAAELLVRDTDDDGDLDVVAVEPSGSIIEVIENDGAGNLSEARARAPMPNGILGTGDIDGDGDLDVLISEYEAGPFGIHTATVYLRGENGQYAPSATLETTGAPTAATLGDVNGDDALDVIIGNYETGTVMQFLGNGDGTFLPRTEVPDCLFVEWLDGADLNDDGYFDVVTICRAAIFRDHIGVLLGSPAGLVRSPQAPSAPMYQSFEIDTGDVNGDGRLDVVLYSYDHMRIDPGCAPDFECMLGHSNNAFAWFLNLGNGIFEPVGHDWALEGRHAVDFATGDVDGDGADELLIPLTFEDVLLVADVEADGSLGDVTELATHDYPTYAAAGDLDGDGVDEVALNHGPNLVSLYHGGEGGLSAPRGYALPSASHTVRFGDLEGDGDVDLVTLSSLGLYLLTQD